MRNLKLVITALLLALLTVSAIGQSGRKQKKAPDLPPVQGVPVPSKTPEPPKSDLPEQSPDDDKEKEKKKASLRGIILGTDWADMNAGMGVADYVRSACRSELLRAMRDLEVRDTGNMSRSDAIKMAKDEDRFYVVALEFQTFGSQYEVRFMIYEPKTAKNKGTGSASIYPDRSGRISAYSYQRTGADLARQILGRLDLHAPSPIPVPRVP